MKFYIRTALAILIQLFPVSQAAHEDVSGQKIFDKFMNTATITSPASGLADSLKSKGF